MHPKVKQLVSAALVDVRGVDNSMIPNILEAIGDAETEKAITIALAGSARIRNLNPGIIPNVVAAILSALKKGGISLKEAPAETEVAETEKAASVPKVSRRDIIFDAVKMVMDEGDPENLTSAKVPKVEVLASLVGFDVSATERDTAVKRYQK